MGLCVAELRKAYGLEVLSQNRSSHSVPGEVAKKSEEAAQLIQAFGAKGPVARGEAHVLDVPSKTMEAPRRTKRCAD